MPTNTVSDESVVIYVCLGAYDASVEKAFHPLKLGVSWPVAPAILSDKDLAGVYR